MARDLTERKQSQARIEFLAYFDGLTGLPNRIRFKDRLQQDLARAARAGERLAVLCIDLDRFKEVNDTQGHDAGDELLAQVAARIQGLVEAQDTVARLSGDGTPLRRAWRLARSSTPYSRGMPTGHTTSMANAIFLTASYSLSLQLSVRSTLR